MRSIAFSRSDGYTDTVSIQETGDLSINRAVTETAESVALLFLSSREFEEIVAKWIEQRAETIKELGNK